MTINQEELEILKKTLGSFSGKDFNIFLTKKLLNLDNKQIRTAQFVFWFCYEVERTIDRLLNLAWTQMESINGETTQEQIDFIKNQYDINLEHIIPEHPRHNPEKIYFNNRIDLIEKINGKSRYTEFLRKIKVIRNNISHGRIENLKYDGQDLLDDTTKAKLFYDYMERCVNFLETENIDEVMTDMPSDK